MVLRQPLVHSTPPVRSAHARRTSMVWTKIGIPLAIVLAATTTLAAELKWTQHAGWREAPLDVPAGGKTGFTLIRPEQTGILITNHLDYVRSEANQNLMNGCGVAAGDFDGDGRCDLYFASCEGPNGLFRNTGQWRFENVTATAGVAAT